MGKKTATVSPKVGKLAGKNGPSLPVGKVVNFQKQRDRDYVGSAEGLLKKHFK